MVALRKWEKKKHTIHFTLKTQKNIVQSLQYVDVQQKTFSDAAIERVLLSTCSANISKIFRKDTSERSPFLNKVVGLNLPNLLKMSSFTGIYQRLS